MPEAARAFRGGQGGRWRVVVALGVALCFPRRAAVAQEQAAYAHRVDSLRAATDSVKAALARLNTPTLRSLVDTVRAGELVVATEPSLHALAAAAAHIASDSLAALVGGGTRRLAGTLFLRSAIRNGVSELEAGSAASSGRGTDLPLTADRFTVARAWIETATILLDGTITGDLRTWSGFVPIARWDDSKWTSIRYGMVTAPIFIVRQCIAGNIAACEQALGLTPTTDPLTQWYDEADRLQYARMTVRQLQVFAAASRNSASAFCPSSACDSSSRGTRDFALRTKLAYATRCVGGAATACDTLFRLRLNESSDAPLWQDVHQSLLREALTLGGPDAFDRLANSRGTVAERIAATAGVPLDSVVRAWRRTVLTTANGPTSVDTGTVVSSLVWALACGTLALRSSRWR